MSGHTAMVDRGSQQRGTSKKALIQRLLEQDMEIRDLKRQLAHAKKADKPKPAEQKHES